MKQTVKERLIEFIEYKKLSKSKFEKEVGLSNGYLNQLRCAPSVDKIERIILAYPELNQSWLLTGEGDMINNSHAAGVNQYQNGGTGNTQSVTMNQAETNRFMDEIAAQRRMTEKAQEQIDRLLTLLEGKLGSPPD